MAAKTANVLARVAPDVKAQAEAILSQLGVPASVAINMLYKQIILQRGLPFAVTVPAAPLARDEMGQEAFDEMMRTGMEEALADNSVDARDSFAQLRRELTGWTTQ